MTAKEAQTIVEEINQIRLANKNQWYSYIDPIFNLKVKGYNTWIQRIERGKYIDGSPMEMKVKEFKQWLYDWLIGIHR